MTRIITHIGSVLMVASFLVLEGKMLQLATDIGIFRDEMHRIFSIQKLESKEDLNIQLIKLTRAQAELDKCTINPSK